MRIQIGDHEIKIVKFADDSHHLLKRIACLNRIQVILKLHEDASSLKINLSKAKAYGLGHKKIELFNHRGVARI